MKRNTFQSVCNLFNCIDDIDEALCKILLKNELIKLANIYEFNITDPADYWKNVMYLTSLYKINVNADLFDAFEYVLKDCLIESNEYDS